MLKIRFIVVDRTRASFLKEGEGIYLERLRRYTQIEWIEVKSAVIRKGRTEKDIRKIEGREIAKRLKPGDYVIALDPSGRQYNSEKFAGWLEKLSINVRGWVSFIIGGPIGLSSEISDRANSVLSLSKLTLTHEMCRIFLLEQVYRAFTIMEGGKYHK
jgi:23S rRNA (pseudouridine1915-N3)-methyltransferase